MFHLTMVSSYKNIIFWQFLIKFQLLNLHSINPSKRFLRIRRQSGNMPGLVIKDCIYLSKNHSSLCVTFLDFSASNNFSQKNAYFENLQNTNQLVLSPFNWSKTFSSRQFFFIWEQKSEGSLPEERIGYSYNFYFKLLIRFFRNPRLALRFFSLCWSNACACLLFYKKKQYPCHFQQIQLSSRTSFSRLYLSSI